MEWPKTVWRLRDGGPWNLAPEGDRPPNRDDEFEIRDLIPADLGRELYEALRQLRYESAYGKKQESAAARYEREVGS